MDSKIKIPNPRGYGYRFEYGLYEWHRYWHGYM